jgi:hypothetical protein
VERQQCHIIRLSFVQAEFLRVARVDRGE